MNAHSGSYLFACPNSGGSEPGFTLLELLVCMSIAGLLAAISFRAFAVYKTGTFDARAEHDLRNALSAQEAYFADNDSYAGCINAACEDALDGFALSEGTEITLTLLDEGLQFRAIARHPLGRRVYLFNSLDRTMLSL